MADTRADITIPPNTWVNCYAASGIAPGVAVDIFNKGARNCNVAIKLTAPSTTTIGVPLYNGEVGSHMYVSASESGLWAYSVLGTILLIQEN